jgi:hypothetical protein
VLLTGGCGCRYRRGLGSLEKLQALAVSRLRRHQVKFRGRLRSPASSLALEDLSPSLSPLPRYQPSARPRCVTVLIVSLTSYYLSTTFSEISRPSLYITPIPFAPDTSSNPNRLLNPVSSQLKRRLARTTIFGTNLENNRSLPEPMAITCARR